MKHWPATLRNAWQDMPDRYGCQESAFGSGLVQSCGGEGVYRLRMVERPEGLRQSSDILRGADKEPVGACASAW